MSVGVIILRRVGTECRYWTSTFARYTRASERYVLAWEKAASGEIARPPYSATTTATRMMFFQLALGPDGHTMGIQQAGLNPHGSHAATPAAVDATPKRLAATSDSPLINLHAANVARSQCSSQSCGTKQVQHQN